MRYIYRVMVHTIGKTDYEKVRDFDSEKVAFKYVEELRKKNKIGLESGHGYHFANLEWCVEKRLGGED